MSLLVSATRWLPQPSVKPRSSGYFIAVACSAAFLFGAFLPVAPRTAVAALVLIPIAFAAPVAALAIVIAVTVLVPFEIQDTFAVIGGRDQPGLLVVDALVMLGLLRIGWMVVRRRLEIDLALLTGIGLALICTAALVWGLTHDADVSEAGHEARRLVLGVGGFLLAWAVMADQSARRRLARVLIVIGLALGFWGLAQWMLSVGYTSSADIGVRPGVDLTTAGRGMLQGGMFAFPVAVTLAWAALVSGRVRQQSVQWVLATIVVLNGICVLLTYERTIWLATAVACVLVVVITGAMAVRPAIRWVVVGLATLACVAVIAPGEARTALERMMSVSQVSTDESFTYRIIESDAVVKAIAERPITGAGLGATVTWDGRGDFATLTTSFVHNGYLWLAWKVGVPAAVFVVLVVCMAIIRRAPGACGSEWRSLRIGSKASLVALLLICITFPAFNVLGITAAMGLLVAVCYSRAEASNPARGQGGHDD